LTLALASPNIDAMNMTSSEFIDRLGGTAEVARLCGISKPSVSGWRNASIPADKLIRLAPIAEKRGVATRKELFPKDYQEIWPELAEAA